MFSPYETHGFNCWHTPALFDPGWFFESLFTQTLITHVVRIKRDPVSPELGQLATHPHFGNHCRGGCLADGFAPGRRARVCPIFAPVLVATGAYWGVMWS